MTVGSVGPEVLIPRRRHVHQVQSSTDPQTVVTRGFWGALPSIIHHAKIRLLLGTGVTSPEQQREGRALIGPGSLPEGGASRYFTSQVGKREEGNGIFASRGAKAGED